MIEATSVCFQAFPRDAPWAKFLEPDRAASFRDHLQSALGEPKWFYYERFRNHELSKKDGLAEISMWPGGIVWVTFLDLTDPRVLRLQKAFLNQFFDEYIYPTEESYFISEDSARLMCFDHSDRVHSTII
jgi:hypothetical protein